MKEKAHRLLGWNLYIHIIADIYTTPLFIYPLQNTTKNISFPLVLLSPTDPILLKLRATIGTGDHLDINCGQKSQLTINLLPSKSN